MSSEWSLIASLLGVVWLLRVCAVRADIVADQAERIDGLERALEREQAKTANRFRPRPLPAWVTEPVDGPLALPAGPYDPKPRLRELEPGAFADIEVIDLSPDAANTVETPLPTPEPGQRFPTPDPKRGLIDPTQVPERLRQFLQELPGWPGTQKENASVR